MTEVMLHAMLYLKCLYMYVCVCVCMCVCVCVCIYIYIYASKLEMGQSPILLFVLASNNSFPKIRRFLWWIPRASPDTVILL